jgi:hypothetical protein
VRHHDRVQPASGTVGSPLPSRSRLLVHCAKMGATPNDTTRTLFCARAIADEGSGEPRARQRIRFTRGAHRARHYDDPHGKDCPLASWTKGLSTLVRPLKYGRHLERLIRCARRYRCESGDDRDEESAVASFAQPCDFLLLHGRSGYAVRGIEVQPCYGNVFSGRYPTRRVGVVLTEQLLA